MSLTVCKECGKQVSTDSRFCPHCGKNKPAKQGMNGWLVAILVFMGLGVVGRLFSPSSQHNSTVSTVAQPTPDSIASAKPQRIPPPDNGIKMYYTVMPAPCAVDRSTVGTMAGVISDRDAEGLQGLEESGKVLVLAEGTKFEGLPFPDGLVLGYVRSGRNIGKECYMLNELLQTNRPHK